MFIAMFNQYSQCFKMLIEHLLKFNTVALQSTNEKPFLRFGLQACYFG